MPPLTRTMWMRPDIRFRNIHMEPVGGIQYLHRLRQFKKAEIALIPVVFLTADRGKATVVISKSATVNAYIVKPTSAAKPKDHINRLLGPAVPWMASLDNTKIPAKFRFGSSRDLEHHTSKVRLQVKHDIKDAKYLSRKTLGWIIHLTKCFKIRYCFGIWILGRS